MISVITPVYNAELYLEKAIESVLIQPEVSEYILIDDGSTDQSWQIIKRYAKNDKRIVALQHKDKKNLGRSKSRNLGIKHSSNDWIAFLDADDFYLKDRFENDIKLISQDPYIDGIYNAIGAHFHNSYKGPKNIPQILTSLKEKIPHDKLFENMSPFNKGKGRFSCDGFLVKKKCVVEVGGFNENLMVAEDTELWSKLALLFKLVPGKLEQPVAKRGIHNNNSFQHYSTTHKYLVPELLMYLSLLRFVLKKNSSKERKKLVVNTYLAYLSKFCQINKITYIKYWYKGLFSSTYTMFNKQFYSFFLRSVFTWTRLIYKYKIKSIFK